MTDEPKAERRFSIKKIVISRGYSNDGPFTAAISVESTWEEEIKVNLPEDRVLALIELCDDLVVDALSQQFNNMREDMVAAIATREQKLLEAQTVDV